MIERETERAFYGQERFRLAPDYEQFYRELVSFAEPRKKDHMRKFLQFTSAITDTYKKPFSPPVKKTRRNQDEAEIFQDRIIVSAKESVTPLKLEKAGDTGDWVVEKSNKSRYHSHRK